MKRVIKAFQKFDESLQEEIYDSYQNGDLGRASFPFNGEIAAGVIFEHDESETVYLIPVETIKSSKLSMASDDDDDDDDDRDESDEIVGADDDENVDDDADKDDDE